MDGNEHTSTVLRPRPTRPRARPPGRFRALDGLRGIAVLSVMLFHFGLGGMHGGFLGVDVFFVLSGYLITGQLVTRWVLGGPIDLASFWLARARRLLPALGAMLIGTTTAVLVFDRAQVGLFRGDLTAAATYSSNWWYIFHQRSYFVSAGRPPLLLHLWSLAVEEQFYLVWPLVVALVVLACKRPETRRVALIAIAVGIALASSVDMGLGSALSHAPQAGDPSRWYFGSDSHVMGLLIGATLALARWGDGLGAVRAIPRAAASVRDTVLGTAALVTLVYLLFRTDEFSVWLYRCGFVAVGLLTAAVIAVATRPGPLATVLSPPILRGIGKRSYGLYLWHWPVACFTRPGIDLPIPPAAALALRLGLTFLIAEVSYQRIELPVRQRGWHFFWTSLRTSHIGSVRTRTLITVFVTSLLAAVMVTPATAAPSDRDLASGGTVYVSNPGDPGSLHRVAPPAGSGSSSGSTSPTFMQRPSAPISPTAPATPPRHAAQLRDYPLWVYGDSVALGAIPDLAARFASVTNEATEGVQSWTLLPELTADADAGSLDNAVVLLHTGDNGVVNRSGGRPQRSPMPWPVGGASARTGPRLSPDPRVQAERQVEPGPDGDDDVITVDPAAHQGHPVGRGHDGRSPTRRSRVLQSPRR